MSWGRLERAAVTAAQVVFPPPLWAQQAQRPDRANLGLHSGLVRVLMGSWNTTEASQSALATLRRLSLSEVRDPECVEEWRPGASCWQGEGCWEVLAVGWWVGGAGRAWRESSLEEGE